MFTPGTSTVAKLKTEFCNLRDYGTSRTERQVNAFFICRDLPPNTRFNILMTPWLASMLALSQSNGNHRMFQLGVDFNRTFTVGLSHWGGTPSNSIGLRKSSAKIVKKSKLGKKMQQKVCIFDII